MAARTRVGVLMGLVCVALGVVAPTASATFPGQNGRLAFAYGHPTAAGVWTPQLATSSPDGSGRQLLTPHTGWSSGPDWSPDGRWIAFQRGPKAGAFDFHMSIWTIRWDGTHARQLTHCNWQQMRSTCLGNFDPAWSPDGHWIVFGRDQLDAHGANHPGLFAVRRDGSGLHRVTTAPQKEGF